jgi:galactitol-specific phosphotransferase system IIB component
VVIEHTQLNDEINEFMHTPQINHNTSVQSTDTITVNTNEYDPFLIIKNQLSWQWDGILKALENTLQHRIKESLKESSKESKKPQFVLFIETLDMVLEGATQEQLDIKLVMVTNDIMQFERFKQDLLRLHGTWGSVKQVHLHEDHVIESSHSGLVKLNLSVLIQRSQESDQ